MIAEISKTARISILGIALLHLCLAIWFARVTPYRTTGIVLSSGKTRVLDIGAPDERQHANYVQHLLDGKGFPVLNPNDKDGLYETYQSHQPPLYYLLAAGFSKVSGAVPTSVDEGAKLRYLNALIGAIGVVGAFALAWIATRREAIAVMTGAFVALLPMNLALSGAVSNEPLLITLSVWGLTLILVGASEGWTSKGVILTGTLLGLACLTKTTALVLLPVLVGSFLIRKSIPQVAGVFGVTLLIAGGWWMRNQSLYGDPLVMKAFKVSFGGSPQASDFIGEFGAFDYWANWVGWWTARSFLGAFGYMDIWLNESALPRSNTPNALYRIWIAVAVLGFLGWMLFMQEAKVEERKRHGLLGVFLLCVIGLFLMFNMTYFQAQARYLFAGLPVVALGLALGQDALFKKRWPNASEYVRAGALTLPILLIALGLTLAKLPDEFAKRTTAPAIDGDRSR